MVNAVVSTFAEQDASMRLQVANQINSLHKSRHGNRDFFAGDGFPAMRVAHQLAIRLK
jgi:hypothetical protein